MRCWELVINWCNSKIMTKRLEYWKSCLKCAGSRGMSSRRLKHMRCWRCNIFISKTLHSVKCTWTGVLGANWRERNQVARKLRSLKVTGRRMALASCVKRFTWVLSCKEPIRVRLVMLSWAITIKFLVTLRKPRVVKNSDHQLNKWLKRSQTKQWAIVKWGLLHL